MRAKQGSIFEWFLLATSWVPVVVMLDLRPEINYFRNNLKNGPICSFHFDCKEKPKNIGSDSRRMKVVKNLFLNNLGQVPNKIV